MLDCKLTMPVTDDDEYDGPVSMAATQSTTSKAEQRKSNKPIMEKRRRARINHCLNELKTLILNAMKKDPARHSKLEKADILEMTVKHLQSVQRQQLAAAVSTDPTVITRFRSGFDECAAEVSRYISRLEGVDTAVKQRLSAHLHRCVNSLQQMTPPGHSNIHDDNNNSSSQRALLIPSRLPTGEIALVLPNYNSFVAATPNSAFTAIKPPTENNQRRFQPFQVEIPNSHLTAHISLPDGFERKSPAVTSPNFDLPLPSEPPQKPQVSSTESFERFPPKPSLPGLSLDMFERPGVREDHMSRLSIQKVHQRQELSERLQNSSQIQQKPNPNYTLNPKIHSSPQKYVRYGEVRSRPTDPFEPPSKIARFPSAAPHNEHRTSVIVSDAVRDIPAGGQANRPSQSQQDADTTQRDMWRPW